MTPEQFHFILVLGVICVSPWQIPLEQADGAWDVRLSSTPCATARFAPPSSGGGSVLRLRGGSPVAVEFADDFTRQLEKKLGGREKARKSLTNNGFGKLLDDLDDIAQTIASTGVLSPRDHICVLPT